MTAPIHVVLDNIRSAFNVGSILRTSDAGAIAHLHLCGMTPAPPNPRLLRTSLGAEQSVPWSYHERTELALKHLRAQNIPIVAIETGENVVDYTEFAWPSPVALLLGHEVRGIRPDLLERVDATVMIPMQGVKNSLNVATAYGIVLYEILRQWR